MFQQRSGLVGVALVRGPLSLFGPAFVGDYCRIDPDASVGPYSVLGPGTTLRERARIAHSVIDASCYIGRNAVVEGAILGRNCDVRSPSSSRQNNCASSTTARSPSTARSKTSRGCW